MGSSDRIVIIRVRRNFFTVISVFFLGGLALAWLGYTNAAGLGRNRIALVIGVAAVLLSLAAGLPIAVRRGVRVEGRPGELRHYKPFPPRTERLTGDLTDAQLLTDPPEPPEPRSARSVAKETYSTLWVTPAELNWVHFRFSGGGDEFDFKVTLEVIQPGFAENFERWKQSEKEALRGRRPNS